MNTVDWMRRFKNNIATRLDKKTGWGKVELRSEIEEAYREVLEDMINPENLAEPKRNDL